MANKIKRTCSEPRSKWIELFPYGVAVGADPMVERFGGGQSRPVMIFKDSEEKVALPVWLSPLDAGIALSQTDVRGTANSPHKVATDVLKHLGVTVEKCLFVELKGHHQFLELHFASEDKIEPMRVRADVALSFCLNSSAKYFCQIDFIEKCRRMEVEMATDSQPVEVNPKMVNPQRHPYMN